MLDPAGALRRLVFDATGFCTRATSGGWTLNGGWRYTENGGGLIARIGWFLGDPVSERTIELPDGEPSVAYVDGVAHQRAPGAAGSCG